jgi:uncharacterized protein
MLRERARSLRRSIRLGRSLFRIVCAALAIILLFPRLVLAQSFNCRTADRPDEVLICQDSHLSALDERMSSLYYTLRNSLRGPARRALEAAQSSWLRARIACGRDFQCIEVHYERRITELRNY